ncbi:tRNA (adenine(22)-N(1))-methyltransferase [Thalassobacillus hwangdonensis]|uniref:tRNA (Adenine(22)-N(1))-methyltransferase n=1 Tax=Thalassobacillus hwangdonensis TaxID=546108 RepID=A0ABW3KY18_9BACI
MNEHVLSNRLAMVASYLPQGAFFADIGSDHAYLPCFVCLKDEQARAIAGEVNEGPFQSAVNEVEKNDLEDRISVRKGDGLDVLHEGEVDHIIVAGMGGTLISSILENGKEKLGAVKRIIVQPNVDAESCRRWFDQNGFMLTDEHILEESGHIYEVLVADADGQESPYEPDNKEKQLYFGPFLTSAKTQPFIEKWKEELTKKQRVLSQIEKAKQPDPSKVEEFKKKIHWIEEVLGNG